MNAVEMKELYNHPAYRALDDKRKKLASAVLIYGQSFSAGCRVAGLNQSREMKNQKLQCCLREFGYEGAKPAVEDPTSESIYEGAERLEREYNAMTPDQQREYHEKRSAEVSRVCKCGSALTFHMPVPYRDVPPEQEYIFLSCELCHRAADFCRCGDLDWTTCGACGQNDGHLTAHGHAVTCQTCLKDAQYAGWPPRKPVAAVQRPAADAIPEPVRPGRCSRCGEQTAEQHIKLCQNCAVGVNW